MFTAGRIIFSIILAVTFLVVQPDTQRKRSGPLFRD